MSSVDISAEASRNNKQVTPQLHFAKWWNTSTSSQYHRRTDGGQRSASLSPQPPESLLNRPPTPQCQQRGILKSHRRHAFSDSLDAPPSSGPRSVRDSLDMATQLNGGGAGGGGGSDGYLTTTTGTSSNTLSLADSLPRKTVRFADGKPSTSTEGGGDGSVEDNHVASSACG